MDDSELREICISERSAARVEIKDLQGLAPGTGTKDCFSFLPGKNKSRNIERWIQAYVSQ
jgi:hypothetical protein